MGWGDELLIEDVECLGALERMTGIVPVPMARATLWAYRYPRARDQAHVGQGRDGRIDWRAHPLLATLDIDGVIVRIRYVPIRGNRPDRIGLGPKGLTESDAQESAIRRLSPSRFGGSGVNLGVGALLRQNRPRITDHPDGTPGVAGGREALLSIVDAIARRELNAIFVQAPPGAAKTFTGDT